MIALTATNLLICTGGASVGILSAGAQLVVGRRGGPFYLWGYLASVFDALFFALLAFGAT
jgi:hypothetical protein